MCCARGQCVVVGVWLFSLMSAAGCTLLTEGLGNGDLVSSCPGKLLGRGYMCALTHSDSQNH